MPSNDLVMTQVQGVTIVAFQNPSILDGIAVEVIGNDLYALVDRQAKRAVLLNFSQVRFLSSTMLGVLLALHNKATEIDGKVVVCGLRPSLMKVFKVMKLDKLLEFADTEEEAMGRFPAITRS